MRALLTWSSHATIGLDLFLTFKYMGGLRCDVWAGRERCSSGAWSPYTGGTQSELVSVSKFRPGTEYTLEVMTAREAACLQTFPPDYPLHPKKVQALRGVVNALPPAAARRSCSVEDVDNRKK